MDLLTFLDTVADPPALGSAGHALPASETATGQAGAAETVTSTTGTADGAGTAGLPGGTSATGGAARSPGAGQRVVYHSFCQSSNVAGLGTTGVRMLRRAGLVVEELPEWEVCCGFGGSTSLKYPEVSRGIAQRKLANVRATGAAVLTTDNPGCVLHLRGAADAARDRFAVRHAVELIAAQLDRAQ
jgi:hypothetical protein